MKEFQMVGFLYNQLSFANTIWLIWCEVIKPNKYFFYKPN